MRGILALLAILLPAVAAWRSAHGPLLRRMTASFGSSASTRLLSTSPPVGLWVTVEIKPDRVSEFLQVMEADAADSVVKENGGCLKFDVLKALDADNKFHFYEIYRDEAAVGFHKQTPHYQKWIDFKATGAVLSVTASKLSAPIFASLKKD